MTLLRRAHATLGVLALASVLSACGDPKKPPPKFRLEGSLSQVMDLGYDEARILVGVDDLALVFVRIHPLSSAGQSDGGTEENMTGTTEDYPLKLAYRLLGDERPSGGRVDLAELDTNEVQRGSLSRNVANDPRNTFPKLARGTLSFDRPLDDGAIIHGDFHVTFENGIEVASGRTAFANYTAKVQP